MNKPVKNLSLLASGAAGDEPKSSAADLLGPVDGAMASTATPAVLTPPAAKGPGANTKTTSRALNAVVRTSTQVALATHFEPAPHPKIQRAQGHAPQHGVVLTETEKIRLQVMQVQIKLTGLALYDGPVDGVMNPETIAGVRHFQTLKGMRDSGVLTVGTLHALGVHPLG